MNRFMNTVSMMAVAGLLVGGTTACGAENSATNQTHAVNHSKGAAVVKAQEMTLTGVVAQQEVSVAGKQYTTFVLITPSGEKLHLPKESAGKKGCASAPRLEDYLNQNVKLVVMGAEKKKGDKTVVRVKTIKTIEKVAA